MSALGGAVIACTAIAAIGIAGSVVLETFEMKKTKTFRYLLTDTFYLCAFGGLLIAIGYFFSFWDRHTHYEKNGLNGVTWGRKSVGLVWGVLLCGASVYLLSMWKKHRGGQTSIQGTVTSSTTMATPVPKESLKESVLKTFSKLKLNKNLFLRNKK